MTHMKSSSFSLQPSLCSCQTPPPPATTFRPQMWRSLMGNITDHRKTLRNVFHLCYNQCETHMSGKQGCGIQSRADWRTQKQDDVLVPSATQRDDPVCCTAAPWRADPFLLYSLSNQCPLPDCHSICFLIVSCSFCSSFTEGSLTRTFGFLSVSWNLEFDPCAYLLIWCADFCKFSFRFDCFWSVSSEPGHWQVALYSTKGRITRRRTKPPGLNYTLSPVGADIFHSLHLKQSERLCSACFHIVTELQQWEVISQTERNISVLTRKWSWEFLDYLAAHIGRYCVN